MSLTAHLLVLLAGALLAVGGLVAVAYDKRRRQAAAPPVPKSPRPIVILGAGGIVRAAHLPAYAKAGFPVIAVADSASGKAALGLEV